MSRPVAIAVAYCAALGVVLGLGCWARAGARADARRLGATEERLAEIRALSALGPAGGAPREAAGPPLRPAKIGAAVQAAAEACGLGAGSLEQVTPIGGAPGPDAGGRHRCRIGLRRVRVGPLVRFIHELEHDAGLRAAELEMSRPEARTETWDVSLVIAGAGR